MRLRGDTEVNVEIRERSDREMVKLMQLENLTQCQNNARGVADSLAAEVRIAAREYLLRSVSIPQQPEHTAGGNARARQQLLDDGPAIARRIAELTALNSMKRRKRSSFRV